MEKKLLFNIEGCDVFLFPDHIEYIAHGRIDDDGSSNKAHDPDWQPDTSLHYTGRPIDADSIPYIVVPPQVLFAVAPTILGCHAVVANLQNRKSTDAVTADVGPHKKLGEMSEECARRIGLNPSPTDGGTEDKIICYKIFFGQPACVDSKVYSLQPWHKS